MKAIRKLNELKHSESFLQVDYSKGFKYIDKAGEILNLYADKKSVPKNSIGIDGLYLEKPGNGITDLKVSGVQFWLHSEEPANLGNVETVFTKEFRKLHSIIAPESITRLGWRNYFIIEGLEQDDLKRILNYKEILSSQSITNLTLIGKIDAFKVKIELKPLKGTGTQKRGLLFDIDLYTDQEMDSPDDVAATLTEMRQKVNAKIPSMANEIVK